MIEFWQHQPWMLVIVVGNELMEMDSLPVEGCHYVDETDGKKDMMA